MPLPGLLRRERKSETNLRRRSVMLELLHSSKSTENDEPQSRPSNSSESPYLVPEGSPRPSYQRAPDRPNTPVTPPSNDPISASSANASVDHLTLHPPRFTLMRSRHASDSQLSTRSKQQASSNGDDTPPLPSVPPTPAIITTAPTMDTMDRSHKKRPRLKIPDRMKAASERKPECESSTHQGFSVGRRSKSDGKGKLGADSMDGSRVTFNEPEKRAPRASGEPPPYGDESNSSLALPISRLSESSRSEGSNGETVAYATTTTTHTVSTTTTFFRLPRRKKTPTPLFPLPDRVPQSSASSANGGTPRVSTNVAPESKDQSPARAHSAAGPGSPLPSPSHAFAMASSTSLGGEGIRRKNSTTSARSAKSSPSRGQTLRLGRRGRASTVDGPEEPPLPTPPLPSGRTSTSTAGRSSLGGVFSMSSRFRQESEPPFPRQGSPITPRECPSQSNSFTLAREAVVIPEREADDTPGKYLSRLEEAVSRGAVASILSKSSDAFSQAVLRSYMRSFAFFEDPMDMAIRKLLMEVELPKETQQIDRVLQSFADRYHECNPGIYASPDQAYFIAFSLLILHTDVFNKNNKHKMMKPDYLKNTKGEGVSDDILECFYDNISYTPFIHVEDDVDINGERLVAHKARKGIFPRAGVEAAKKAPKGPVDPYTLIIDHKLDTLRPSVKDIIPFDDPFGYLGTATSLDLANLQKTFFRSGVLQIVSARSRPDAFMSPTTITNPDESHPGVVDIKITKVGVIWRKDARKKKARSPWQEWGAILTGSQLYFFRNTGWVKNLMHQYEQHHKQGFAGSPVIFKPPLENFKPDTLLSTDDAVALRDEGYRKHKNSFMFIRPNGFEETFLADNEREMNDWLAKLNYAASFRTAGVRMRGVVGGSYEGQRNRVIRRTEDSDTGKTVQSPTGEVSVLSGKIDPQLAEQIWEARRQIMCQKIKDADEELAKVQKQLDIQLRNARHLQILAPIQAKTRESIIVAAMHMAARLRWNRLQMWRLKCHRDILALDLEDEHKANLDLQKRNSKVLPALPPQVPCRESSKVESSKVDLKESPKRLLRSSRGKSGSWGATPSKDRQYGLGDIFQTPPELARQASYPKTQASWELPPLSFGSRLSNHGDAKTNDSVDGPALEVPVEQASVDGSPATRHSSVPETIRLATRNSSVDIGEIEVLKEAGLVKSNGTSSTPQFLDGISEPEDNTEQTPTKSGEKAVDSGEPFDKSKVRRSLHRTLREAHVPAHHRSKKGRDSGSGAVVADDIASTPESEGLARGTGSFTVHGKKASVISFGSEWHNMSPEERLRLRKQAHNEGKKLQLPLAAEDDGDEEDDRPPVEAKATPDSKVQGLVARYESGRRKSASLSDLAQKQQQQQQVTEATTGKAAQDESLAPKVPNDRPASSRTTTTT